MIYELFSLEDFFELYKPESFIYLLFILIIILIGKKVFDLFAPFNLDEELTKHDNKAVAVSFCGYMTGIGIILWGVLSSGQVHSLWKDILDTLIWGVTGILLLQIARIFNDKILLKGFNNIKELIVDKNVGTGAAECGTYIGSSYIIMATVSGEGNGFLTSLAMTVIFFFAGQGAFFLFSLLFQKITRFDLHHEIEKDNVSAGVGFGMTMAAMGMLLSHAISMSNSIFVFILWFIISAALLVSFRYLVDKFILPGSLLDEEISKDHNWGAALLNGSLAVIVALLVNAAY